ncbi:MAG: protease modulator HflC [Gammaproteobacteria bacterium]|nr:protease modulator HflC [Gammaproteobacteria bacterium]
MNTIKSQIIIALLVLLVALAPQALYTVTMMEKAVLLRFEKVQRSGFEPGLYFKVPFIDQVVKFDKRTLTLDAEPERFLTKEKKFLIVDSFIMWRIEDEEKYFTTTGGDEFSAQRLLAQKVNSGLRDEFGVRTIKEVVSGERREVMKILQEQANTAAAELGVHIVDVRIKKVDLPDAVSDAVYNRMISERTRVAKELRSQGAEAAERIRADADRKRTEIIADAYRQAQEIRGQGDAVSAETYANAYSRNKEFFSLYRSLEAYRKTFQGGGDIMVMEPDSEFFRYFKDPLGKSAK